MSEEPEDIPILYGKSNWAIRIAQEYMKYNPNSPILYFETEAKIKLDYENED